MTGTATAVCPSCGVDVAPGDRFCEACGLDFGHPAAAVALQTAVPGGVAGCCVACGEDLPRDDTGYCGVCGFKQPAPGDRHEVADRDVAAVTDRGRRRGRNEDAFAVSTTSRGRILAVICDGVSTTISPDQASRRAADAAIASLRRQADQRSAADALADAFAAAVQAVNEVEWAPHGGIGPPSCTFLAAVTDGNKVELSSMGDCRAFWLPEVGEPEKLTQDDSWASDQVRSGTMTSDAANADRRSHSITRWLGNDADPTWQPRPVSFAASHPGRLVLCSDGLWNYAGGATDVAEAAGSGDPLSVARRLVDYANRRGGHDNITVVVVDIAADTGTPQTVALKGPVS